MTDYVYDVKWNLGGKPGVFACCDGDGQINIFDLTRDFKHPLLTKNPIQIHNNAMGKNINKKKRVAIAATTLQWTYDGKYLACSQKHPHTNTPHTQTYHTYQHTTFDH